jgi:1-acyl-sn-glycerol-3-phosphate acyltransferase
MMARMAPPVPASPPADAPGSGASGLRPRAWAIRALALLGWRLCFVPPPGPRAIVIVYPHTSNWDFAVGYLAKLGMGMPAHWIGKDSLFRWPVGVLLRRMGGIAVNRRERTGLVGQLAREMASRPRMWLAISPEGTRSRTDHWKSGFYRLAREAGVPVGLGFVDWGTRTVGVTTWLALTGDEEADLGRIRAAYAGMVGRRPGQEGEIRFQRAGPTQG